MEGKQTPPLIMKDRLMLRMDAEPLQIPCLASASLLMVHALCPS